MREKIRVYLVQSKTGSCRVYREDRYTAAEWTVLKREGWRLKDLGAVAGEKVQLLDQLAQTLSGSLSKVAAQLQAAARK